MVIRDIFHDLRDKIRYYKAHEEIKNIAQKYSKMECTYNQDNLGEPYLLARAGAFDGKVVFTNKGHVKAMLELFPSISAVELVSKYCYKYISEAWEIKPSGVYFNSYGEGYPSTTVESAKMFVQKERGCYKEHEMCFSKEQIVEAEKKLKEIDWLEEKTVMIFPDANTFVLDDIKDEVWIQLADWLKLAGYKVVFNTKKMYEGYTSVFWDISTTVMAVRKFGFALGLRNGMFDILAGSTAAKLLAFYIPDDKPINFEIVCHNGKQIKIYDEYIVNETAVNMGDFRMQIWNLKAIRPDEKIIEAFWLENSIERLNMIEKWAK